MHSAISNLEKKNHYKPILYESRFSRDEKMDSTTDCKYKKLVFFSIENKTAKRNKKSWLNDKILKLRIYRITYMLPNIHGVSTINVYPPFVFLEYNLPQGILNLAQQFWIRVYTLVWTHKQCARVINDELLNIFY